jgi:glycosyltransferase involved in cell wall biosynthesis
MNPVLVFEPDAYLLTGPSLMGRQSAGHGFLRASVASRGEAPVRGHTPLESSARAFDEAVRAIDPSAATEWISGRQLDRIAQVGLIYRPDQEIWIGARQRLRAGPAAYSICGVTHTLATSRSLSAIAKIPTEPLMPWDALICTSQAALSVVADVLREAVAFQRWRMRQPLVIDQPMLPVIPLGVHCEDFSFTSGDRAAARSVLGLGADEVALLSAGRLSLHAKAHPYPMLSALQRAADESGQHLALIFAGQAFSAPIRAAFETAAATVCPSVRTLFVDGKDFEAYRGAWAAADIFISLADSIQETFGLTPIEAMAAGLPALVSDWDGYRDTVRDGVDGFRIPTWAPAGGGGQALAQDYESGALTYDNYLFGSSTAVAVERLLLDERLRELVTNPGLRQQMGASGQARARDLYDWRTVYRSYQALWTEQQEVRQRARTDAAAWGWLAEAPRHVPEHAGPFDRFKAFPTRLVSAATRISLVDDLSVEAYRDLIAHPILQRWSVAAALYEDVHAKLCGGPMTIAELVKQIGAEETQAIEVVARLAKIGVIALDEPDAGDADAERAD